jgi:hypothetical protein
MQMNLALIRSYLLRLTSGRGGSAPDPMADLSEYDPDIEGLRRKAERDGNLDWLRLSMESLILNPAGRIGAFGGQGFPYTERELETLFRHAYARLWPDRDLPDPAGVAAIDFVSMTDEEWDAIRGA